MTTDLGYQFHRATGPSALGNHQLDINLYSHPTEHHFDPERAQFWVIEPNGQVSQIRVVHPWHGQHKYRVCTGRIILWDRRDKEVEAFSLGGELEIVNADTYTSCTLTSTAPIANLTDTGEPITILTSEFEAILAQKMARWGADEAAFKKRLAEIEPRQLFVAGLLAVDRRLKHMPATASLGKVLRVVDQAIKIMKSRGDWPASPPALDDLLRRNP